MPLSSIGDLAQSYANRGAHTRINRQLSDLATQLTTGLKTDRRMAVSGDTAGYSALERTLSMMKSYTQVARETSTQAAGLQSAVGKVAAQVDAILPNLLQGEPAFGEGFSKTIVVEAEQGLQSTMSALNTSVGGRYLFSGTAIGTPPLRNADEMLADLRPLVAGATDAATAVTLIDQYFAAGGGFETNDYIGGADNLAATDIAPNTSIALNNRADDQVFRDTLAGMAKIALFGDGGPGLSDTQRNLVIDNGRAQLLAADTSLVETRAEIGATEARIDAATVGLASETTTLEMARLDLIAADPFETATRLEQTQLQLEQLYTVTARLSRLSLANYI